MSKDTELCEYLGEDVVHLITFLKCSNKVQLDYKLIGNHHGTTLVLRFAEPSTAMHESTPLPSHSHKSPAARRRDYTRSFNMHNSNQHSEISPMPLSNIVPCSAVSVCETKPYECKQTMTESNQQVTLTENETMKSDDTECDIEEELDSNNCESRLELRQSRNDTLDELYVDKRGGERNLIGVTQDYIVKLKCSTYTACAFDATNSEYHSLKALIKNWQSVDMSEHRYEIPLLDYVLKKLPERVNKWVDVSVVM